MFYTAITFLLLNDNLRPWSAFTGKTASADLLESHDTIFGGVNREVATHERTFAGNLSAASLAYENLARGDLLAAETLDAQAGTGVVVDVLT